MQTHPAQQTLLRHQKTKQHLHGWRETGHTHQLMHSRMVCCHRYTTHVQVLAAVAKSGVQHTTNPTPALQVVNALGVLRCLLVTTSIVQCCCCCES
jgi:hypothetical protein